jgi:hypothetical protein
MVVNLSQTVFDYFLDFVVAEHSIGAKGIGAVHLQHVTHRAKRITLA